MFVKKIGSNQNQFTKKTHLFKLCKKNNYTHPWITSAVIALFRLPKIVNIMPRPVITKNDTVYGMPATVFKATQGVYMVMPIMNMLRKIKVADARRRTNFDLNLQTKIFPWKHLPHSDCVCVTKLIYFICLNETTVYVNKCNSVGIEFNSPHIKILINWSNAEV